MEMEDPRFLKIREVAVVLRVSPMTVYRMVWSGELPATRVGRSFRIQEKDVLSYLGSAKVRKDQ